MSTIATSYASRSRSYAISRFTLSVAAVIFAVFATAPAPGAISQTFEITMFNSDVYANDPNLIYTVEVTDEGVDPNQALFRITNASIASDSVITGVYWQDGVLFGIHEVINPQEPGFNVDFHEGADSQGNGGISPPDLPAGQDIGFSTLTMDGALAAIDSGDPATLYGLNNGEYVEVIFDLMAGGTVSDVITMMGTQEIRVGVHIQSLGDNGEDSASGVNLAIPIPLPGALLLGALGLGMVGWIRRAGSR